MIVFKVKMQFVSEYSKICKFSIVEEKEKFIISRLRQFEA